MGNCVMKGFGNVEEMVKVVTSNGGIMELYAPITAESITTEFPGHGIFPRSPLRHISSPLLHNEQLRPGQYYYLLPLLHNNKNNSNNNNSVLICNTTPYRIYLVDSFMKKTSFDHHDHNTVNYFPKRYNKSSGSGVWKVRLVINTDQLSDILSQDNRTEALIDSVRTVARCATTVTSVH